MKYLALAFLLCALLSLSNAQCMLERMKSGMTHCLDNADGTRHEPGSSWRNSRCMDCTCSTSANDPLSIGCCTAYSTPRQFPDDCVSVFDPEACEYIVHKRDDPTVRCPIYGAVGK